MPCCQGCGCSLSLRRVMRNLMRGPRKVRYAARRLDGQTEQRAVYWLCGPCASGAKKGKQDATKRRRRLTNVR